MIQNVDLYYLNVDWLKVDVIVRCCAEDRHSTAFNLFSSFKSTRQYEPFDFEMEDHTGVLSKCRDRSIGLDLGVGFKRN